MGITPTPSTDDARIGLLGIADLASFVDVLARKAKIRWTWQLFCLGTIGVAGALYFTSFLCRVVLISEPPFGAGLNLQRVGLSAMRGGYQAGCRYFRHPLVLAGRQPSRYPDGRAEAPARPDFE